MIEVFKTNILAEWMANKMVDSIREHFPEYKINVDLEDCDKVLRIESAEGAVNREKIIELAASLEVEINTL